jgi:hypothetical protein
VCFCGNNFFVAQLFSFILKHVGISCKVLEEVAGSDIVLTELFFLWRKGWSRCLFNNNMGERGGCSPWGS